MPNKKVFVSGCYDLLHSGHVEFFRQAAQFGDLYVGIGSDATVLGYKHHRTLYNEKERLFMVKAIRYVTDAFINEGSGILDFVPTVRRIRPDMLVVNEDGDSPLKRDFCKEEGIEYVVLKRTPGEGLQARSSTSLKNSIERIPTRIDLAGTWIDQPYVSCLRPGWAITLSLEPTFPVRDRCGLSSSTRNTIRKIWPLELPDMDPEMLAKLVFCFENDPEKSAGFISGAQDAIGICMPRLVRHYYDKRFWPEKIESCHDDTVLDWLEEHICMVNLFPRPDGWSALEGKTIVQRQVDNLADASLQCWEAALAKDLDSFTEGFARSFSAQVALFPAMVDSKADGKALEEGFLPDIHAYLDKYAATPGVKAMKLSGAGGGGQLILVCSGRDAFPQEAIPIKIRRK